jgi:dethiobiotin synthetase
MKKFSVKSFEEIINNAHIVLAEAEAFQKRIASVLSKQKEKTEIKIESIEDKLKAIDEFLTQSKDLK